MALHEFDYLFAIGMIFAFLDAWNIGANDVANSFATSVASRSLTYPQAMVIAALCEFLGSVLLGSRVADTIRNKILDVTLFEEAPATLLLAMVCAVIGSSLWLTLATRIGAPVSTTHSIVGAIIGSGIACFGTDGIVWGWDGFGKIVASWFIAPAIAGCFAAILFLITKYGVLQRGDKALRNAFYLLPVYYAFTAAVLSLVIVWKGAPSLNLDELSPGGIAGAVLGTVGVVVLLYVCFFLPYMRRRLIKDDWTMRWYHVFIGPTLWKRGPVPPAPPGVSAVPDFYSGHEALPDPKEQIAAVNDEKIASTAITNEEFDRAQTENSGSGSSFEAPTPAAEITPYQDPTERFVSRLAEFEKEGREKKWYNPHGLLTRIMYGLTYGVRQDVISHQLSGNGGFLAGDVAARNRAAPRYDNKVEYLYTFLQALTAGTLSFAHGSNDVSNAVGPLATIYIVWSKNIAGSKSDVPVWILVYGGAAIVIGLWTYGYNLMRNLGNRLTLHSPSRGFSMELGAAITTVFATKLSLPISTTQCIVGATVFVGLCNNDFRAVNFRMVMWCYLSWILTVPCAGIISGCICGIIINAPQFMAKYTMT
ncbi:phosphate-repressible phosphate permease [Myxozyma melibiosi]|uniref:Phosphate transporter n=1 Tax=Myxozyma melibiosi TaxID=54550 RepID=A0ABR1EZ23_9ASCO